jgi:uncharacterized membrane protein YgdD (TMEM256/DUF423 family)
MCIASGALLMLLAVILGAVGSHLLQARLSPARFASYQSGVLYHLVHALALVAIGLLAHVTARTRWLVAAALLFSVGIVCFSGAIYAMAFGAPRALGVVAPFGGVAFMVGWMCVAAHALGSGSRIGSNHSPRAGRGRTKCG